MESINTTSDPPLEQKGGLLSPITRELIGLHKRFYGRGATKARALFPHENLLLVEMENVFLTVEHTMVEKGQREFVREARRTFQSAMRDEFIAVVESVTGRHVECYESVTFTAPDRVLEIFYLEPVSKGEPATAEGTFETSDGKGPT